MTATPQTAAENSRKRGNDPISWYLSTIGRVPLLTHEQELTDLSSWLTVPAGA